MEGEDSSGKIPHSSQKPRPGKQAEFLSQGQLQSFIPNLNSFIPDLNSFIPSKKTRINLGLNPSGPRWGWNVTKFHISSFSCFPAPEKPEFWDQSSPSGAPTNEFLNPVEKLQLWSRNSLLQVQLKNSQWDLCAPAGSWMCCQAQGSFPCATSSMEKSQFPFSSRF